MTKLNKIRHEFVEFIPQEPDEGILYISIPYATATHRCACGCGQEVVTPLSPTDWRLVFDGETVSLKPSIGNWSFGCESHYWIERNRIRWARRMSPKEIEAGREQDRRAKVAQWRITEKPSAPEATAEERAFFRRLFDKLRR